MDGDFVIKLVILAIAGTLVGLGANFYLGFAVFILGGFLI